MTIIILQHLTQRQRLLLLLWEHGSFPCVKRKERYNRPVEWAKKKREAVHKLINNGNSNNKLRSISNSLFPALACNYTPLLYCTGTRQTSISFLGFQWPWRWRWGQLVTMSDGRRPYQQHQQSMSMYLSMYLTTKYLSIYCLLLLHLLLQL